jgi:hypothetical protein
MIGQGLVYEWVLPLQCLRGAATWLMIVIKGGVHDIREQVHDCAKAQRVVAVQAVQGLTQNKLASVGVVANIQ